MTDILISPPERDPIDNISDSHVVVRHLNHFFGQGDQRTQALFDNTLTLPRGQITIMTGPSGSGKTTLLTLIGTLRTAQEGELLVLDNSLIGAGNQIITELRKDIGFIFQMHNLFESLTAIENVKMALKFRNIPSKNAHNMAATILEQLGLGHRLDYKPSFLSGGQRQRVAVARALVTQPKIILADEPTAALDKNSSLEVVSILKQQAKENRSTIIMVTHDSRVLDFADRMVNMVDGALRSNVDVNESQFICSALRQISFFSNMNATELSLVANRMRFKKFKNGELLVREGESGSEFFLVRNGIVDVIRGGGVIASLGTGQYFGERALLTGDARNATIQGKIPGGVYVMGKDDFNIAVASVPDFKTQLNRQLFDS